MAGLLTRIREQPREVLDTIAKSMDVRASEPAMQAICARYMAQITLPEGARVLEVGCGNGAATKLIMQHVSPAQLVGIDVNDNRPLIPPERRRRGHARQRGEHRPYSKQRKILNLANAARIA